MLRAFRPETVFTGSTGGLLVIDYRIDAKRGVLALSGVGALLLFFDVGARVLASNDEARFAVLARDILRHGTWLLPRLGDTPYLNKPPLVAWLIALVSWPTGGVTQSTAIWPSLAAALGIALVTWWIGRRLWDQAVALTAGFVVLTMHGVFTQARTAMPDIVLCLAMTGAMAAFVASDFGARPRVMLLCHLLLAVGFLAKGPAALLGLGVIAVHGLLTREGQWWRRLRYYLPLCPAAALLVAVWYHHLLARRHALVRWATAAAVVVGLVTWQVRDDTRHNAATDLAAVGAASARGDLPLYTLGVPNL